MAEFVLVPYSAHGHVGPFLVLAAELVRRGHSVSVVVGPRHVPAVAVAGARPARMDSDHAPLVPAGWRPADAGTRARTAWARRRVWRDWAVSCHRMVTRSRPDAVVVDPHMPWALRLPGQVVPLWTTHARPLRGHRRVLVNCLPQLQPGRHRLGAGHQFVGPLLGGLPDRGAGLGELPRLGGPTVVVSMGTVFARRPSFLRGIVAAFADSSWTVVLATGRLPVASLGVLPANVLARQWIPQWQVLAQADVLVTHGGMNSVQEALTRGVPMIVAPRSHEQRRTAELLCRWGVARRWPGSAGIRRAAELVVDDPSVRAAVGAARLGMRHDARALAADELLRSVDVR